MNTDVISYRRSCYTVYDNDYLDIITIKHKDFDLPKRIYSPDNTSLQIKKLISGGCVCTVHQL